MKYELRDYQKEASESAVRFFNQNEEKNALMVLPTGCHAKGTKILMWNADPKCVEDVEVGDLLVGSDGKPVKVLSLHRGIDEMFRITPNKGEPFVVNGGHILSLYKTNDGKRHPSSSSRIEEISVREYLATSKTYRHAHKLHRVKRVEFNGDTPLPINPYLLGLIIGDGCVSTGSVCITTMRKEVEEYLRRYADKNDMLVSEHTKPEADNKARTYCLRSKDGKRNSNSVITALRELGLFGCKAGDKFIPTIYKVSDRMHRLVLLAGLLDTDAYYDCFSSSYEYCTKSRRLAEDVVFLCRSLGFYAKIGKPKIVNGCEYYRLQITGRLSEIPTKVRIRWGYDRMQKKSIFVTGFKVEGIGVGEYFGFTLDGNHLYCDGQFFIHHNSGKSLVIADIASRLDGYILVLQPSKEILEQNFNKLKSYGIEDCSIYSASCGTKEISRITFATIGSVMPHIDDFDGFRYVIMDECHTVNAISGQYKTFFDKVKRKILGLTATPYRLSASLQYIDAEGNTLYRPKGAEAEADFDSRLLIGEIKMENRCILKFLTRTRPRVFHDLIYQVDISTLCERGYLSKLRYFDLSEIDQRSLKRNSTGMDFEEKGLQNNYKSCNFVGKLINVVKRLQHPKSGIPRKGILVFTRFIEEAERLVEAVDGGVVITGSTKKKERERILEDFKSGKIKIVANVGVLTTGFDYPELDTIVIARPTMSLALYYQIVGRAIRPHPGKDAAWIVDLGGNYRRFGRVEDLHLYTEGGGKYFISGICEGNYKPLTNIYF